MDDIRRLSMVSIKEITLKDREMVMLHMTVFHSLLSLNTVVM